MSHKKPLGILEKTNMPLSRRFFLKLAGGLGFWAASAPPLLMPRFEDKGLSLQPATLKPAYKAKRLTPVRKAQESLLSFYNRHTGEWLKKCVFWADGAYNPTALKEIDKLFRDHRTETIHEIDRNLLHVLYKIQKQLETTEPFHLISGYRSPKSNRALNAYSRGVAKNSQHVYGKAADIYVPGRTLKHVQGAAKNLRAGGVGRYTEFVHVDTGRVRYWGAA